MEKPEGQGHSRQHELSHGGLNSLELSGRFRNSHMARTKDLQVHGERDSRTGGQARVFVWIQNFPLWAKEGF